MAEPKVSIAEQKLRAIQHTVVLAAWLEDARQTLGRLEEIREFYPDIDARLVELDCMRPMVWSKEESAALVGVMLMAERACLDQ